MNLDLDWSRIFGILSLIATLAAGIGAALEQINPKYAAFMILISGSLSAFTKRVHKRSPRASTVKKFMSLVVVFSFTAALTGCEEANKTLRTARESSAKIQIYGSKLIRANIDAFKADEISKSDLAELNRYTGGFVTGVGIYREALKEVEQLAARSDGTVSRSALDKLSLVFSEQVVNAFFALVNGIKLIPGAESERIKSIISVIRLAILSVQSALATARDLQKGRAAMELEKVFALLRRYAEAIAEGRIEARAIPAMTDAELAEFDGDLFEELQAAQEEAERLAAE